tara:strand:- start:108 stop:428 length:321 start_codon:yes stop_codon:yes gene_type:complete
MLFNRDEMNDFKQTVHFQINEDNGLWQAFYLRPGTDDMPSYICSAPTRDGIKRKAMIKMHEIYQKAKAYELAARLEMGLDKPDPDSLPQDMEIPIKINVDEVRFEE